jgi:hypothetical protein
VRGTAGTVAREDNAVGGITTPNAGASTIDWTARVNGDSAIGTDTSRFNAGCAKTSESDVRTSVGRRSNSRCVSGLMR